VLEDISLRLPAGARLAVLGRNGAGKSTLLATLMGLTHLHSGRLRLDGLDISATPTHRRAVAGLGLVPQTRDIFASLSVEENLISARRGAARLDQAYALFPRLAERRRAAGGQLSGGEQQMLSIARTLMTGPRLLLLDEPLEGLAPVLRDSLMAVFRGLAADGLTIVLVEQHADLVLEFAETGIILDGGRIVHTGPAAALRSDRALLERHLGLALADPT
jgi:branched-chain amino acid transport system ATP-binding protein